MIISTSGVTTAPVHTLQLGTGQWRYFVTEGLVWGPQTKPSGPPMRPQNSSEIYTPLREAWVSMSIRVHVFLVWFQLIVRADSFAIRKHFECVLRLVFIARDHKHSRRLIMYIGANLMQRT